MPRVVPASPPADGYCHPSARQWTGGAADGLPGVFRNFPGGYFTRGGSRSLVGGSAERFGWIDLLVNNAGVAPIVRTDILQASEESFDRVMGANLKGPYFLTQAVANFWVAHIAQLPAERRKPKIVNISSVSGYAVSVNRGEYCLSKAALSMMTRLFAVRLAEYGINVYEVRPGIVATDMTAPVKEYYERRLADGLTPIRRWGTPEDVGQAVAAIAEDRFPFSTGAVIDVDGGYHMHRL